ncbi:MAG: hypothetical protein AB7G39_11710, partial [Alphaproteobacteria bacterium]
MTPLALQGEAESRLVAAVIGLSAAAALLVLFHFTLEGAAERLLIDRNFPTYPLTIQNVMWLVFGVGLAEIWIRFRTSRAELAEVDRHYLPEDRETLLRGADLGGYYRTVSQSP